VHSRQVAIRRSGMFLARWNGSRTHTVPGCAGVSPAPSDATYHRSAGSTSSTATNGQAAPPPRPPLNRRAVRTKGAAAPAPRRTHLSDQPCARWMHMRTNQPRVSGASCTQRGRSRPRGRRRLVEIGGRAQRDRCAAVVADPSCLHPWRSSA